MIEAEQVPEENRSEPGWLALRADADTRAREAALPLVHRLGEWLRDRQGKGAGDPVGGHAHGIDIGTGTGANHAYLSARFGHPIRWTVLDHDPDLLAHPRHADATGLLAEIADLPRLLLAGPAGTFLTCSAVLDVVGTDDLAALADVIVERRLPALLSLSVTGAVELFPRDDRDDRITEAFNAHQRRGGRPGPDAPVLLAERLPAGWLTEVPTAWRLTASRDPGLLDRYLRERAEVAIDSDPDLTGAAMDWLGRRLADLASGHLRVEVGHVDQLVLPT